MFKLFIANLKMMVRGRQSLFWALAFPLMFTIIFGFFFSSSSGSVGTVAWINKSETPLAMSIEKAATDSGLFKIQKESDVNTAKNLLKKSKVTAIVEIPAGFGSADPVSPKQIDFINDPANTQANLTIQAFLSQFLTATNFQIQQAKPIYSVNPITTADKSLNYFDFVLMGLIGLALMNSSVQGIAIVMAKYREEKILKRITTTPLASWRFVAAEVLSRLVLNVFQIAMILLIGYFGFHAHIIGNLFLLLVFSLLGGLLFQTIGFAVASVSKTEDAAQGMSVAITIPMMFLAGVFFPIDQLPSWLLKIVQFLPLAPLLRMIRQIGIENISPFTNPTNILIVSGWIVVMLAVSIWRFRLSDE